MPPRRLADQPLTAAATPMSAHHLGRGSGLVDEYQPFRVKPRLAGLPVLARCGYVGPVLFGGVQSLFFEAHPVALEEPIDRTVRGAHSEDVKHPLHNLRQGQVLLLRDQLQEPWRMRFQRRAALAATRPRPHAPGLTMQFHPPDRRRRAHLEPLRRRTARASR